MPRHGHSGYIVTELDEIRESIWQDGMSQVHKRLDDEILGEANTYKERTKCLLKEAFSRGWQSSEEFYGRMMAAQTMNKETKED